MAPTIQSNVRLEREKKPRTGEKRSDMICRVKYCNTLPDIPFDPKFIRYPFDANRYVQHNTTSLEKTYKWDLLTEHDLGVTIDLINPDVYAVMPDARLDEADEILLEEDSLVQPHSRRSELHQRAESWLRKTEYTSAEYNRYTQSSEKVESKIGYRIRKELESDANMYKDRTQQIQTIRATFETAKQPILKHHSKPNVTPVEVLPVFPDFQMWAWPCAQVVFDTDPAPSTAGQPATITNEDMTQAVIRGMMDEAGDQFVAYFLPTEDTKSQRKRDIEAEKEYEENEEYEYFLAREYNWVVKHKGSRGYEESYMFIVRPDGVYYNEIETRVRLNKRRLEGGKRAAASNTKLAVRHRAFNLGEIQVQEARLSKLEGPIIEEEEDEEEEEDDAPNADREKAQNEFNEEGKSASEAEEAADAGKSSASEDEEAADAGKSSGSDDEDLRKPIKNRFTQPSDSEGDEEAPRAKRRKTDSSSGESSANESGEEEEEDRAQRDEDEIFGSDSD